MRHSLRRLKFREKILAVSAVVSILGWFCKDSIFAASMVLGLTVPWQFAWYLCDLIERRIVRDKFWKHLFCVANLRAIGIFLACFFTRAQSELLYGYLLPQMLPKDAGWRRYYFELQPEFKLLETAIYSLKIAFSYVGLAIYASIIAVSFLRQLTEKIGLKVLLNWITGRYYQPRMERRIIGFIDLKGSVRLCQELGDYRYSRFVQKFINEVSGCVDRSRGTVSHFVGDGLVVCWPAKPWAFDRSFKFYLDLEERLGLEQERYLQEFGRVPDYKCGFHFGEMVVVEVGTRKSDFLVHGDVVNTAARLEGLAGSMGSRAVFSSDFVHGLRKHSGDVQAAGEHILKGRTSPLEVYVEKGFDLRGRDHSVAND